MVAEFDTEVLTGRAKKEITTNYPVHGSHKINCLLTLEILPIHV